MLKLDNIVKDYDAGGEKVRALISRTASAVS